MPNELTGPELAAAVAVEVMGWAVRNDIRSDAWYPSMWAINSWRPDIDRNDTHRMCEEIERRGLSSTFIAKLAESMLIREPYGIYEALCFINSTPEQKCRAALTCVRESKGPTE